MVPGIHVYYVGMCQYHVCACVNAVCGFVVKPCVGVCIVLVHISVHDIQVDM